MEVTEDLFEWLQSYDPDVSCEPSTSGRVLLSPSAVRKLDNGLVFPLILKRLLQFEGNASSDLDTIDWSSKVDNWNAVLSAVDIIGIHLDAEIKELILAGDTQIVVELLEALYSKEMEWRTNSSPKKGRRPRQAPDGALFIESIDVARPLSEADTCLEFLLIAFCSHFRLKQKQAAGLLTEGNRYLSVVLTKGLKGDFLPILRMYADIRLNIAQLVCCIRSETKTGSLTLVASALRPGLLSKSEEVVQEAALFFRDLARSMNDENLSLWQWFTGELGAIEASVSAMRHGTAKTVKDVTAMLFEVSRGRLDEMFLTLVKDHVSDLEQYLALTAEMMQSLAEIEEGVETVAASGVLSALLDTCLREGDVGRPTSLRFSALNLLAFLWRCFHKEVDKNEDIRGAMLSILKKGCRDKSKAISCSCIAQLFHLLEYFYEEKNSAAAVLFKTLQLMLIESFHRANFREFLFENFVLTAENISSLPIGQLTDAVVKQVHLNEGMDFNTFDFDFFIAVSRHPRLEEESAVQLIDILGKVYLSQLHLSKAASIPFMLITSRFLESDPLQEYIYRFAKLAIQMITQGERTKRGMLKQLPRYLNQPVVLGQPLSLEDLAEETNLLQTRNLVLDLLTKIVKLTNIPLNDRLKDILATNAVNVKGAKGEYPRGLIIVLSLIGNPEEILSSYEASNLQLAWRAQDRTPPRYMLALEDAAKPTNRHRFDAQKAIALPKIEPQSEKSVTSKAKPVDKMKLLWEKKAEASKTGQAFILDSVPTMTIETTNVEITEEDWDLISVLFDKYARLLKHLFKSHAGSGYHKDMHSNPTFSHIADRKEAITEGELLAMLRELGLSKQFLTKEEFISMVKSYLKKNGTKDTGYVDFEGFKDMLVKVAVICYSRPGHNMGHLPPVLSVQALINEFRNTVAKAGGDTGLYDEPFVYGGHKDVLRKLNRDLEEDPDIVLPPGYKSRIENDVLYEHLVPEELFMPLSYKTSLELLDEVLFSTFEVHILEPQVIVQEICVATEEAKPMRHSESFTMMSAANPRLGRLPPGLKYETIKQFSNYDHALVLECALTIDDLIYAVENNMTTVFTRRRDFRTPNKITAMQEVQHQIDRLERDKSEQRRRARRVELGQVIEELSTKKQQEKEKVMRVRQKLEYF